MAYQVTATRKRPQDFDGLAGQEFVVATLKSSLKTGRIAHAYLFSGPRGVGKTSAARILARALNCVEGPTMTPCGMCDSCQEIASGNALDVIEIDGASNTSVNDVREIKDEVLFAPSSSRYKVYIIDEVHMLSNSAFNALLKTIEEPPPYIVFVFATTEVHKVPATIRSRCQQFNFRLISLDTIRGLLRLVADESGIQAEEDALIWMAKEATGSLRDAYTLFDQVLSFADTSVTMQLIRDKLGLVGLDRINELMELLSNGKSAEAIELAEEVLQRGVSVEQLVVDLAEYLRNLLFIKHGIRKEDILGASAERFSAAVIDAHSDAQIEHALGLTLNLYRDLRYSLNQRFELELLLSRLSLLRGYIHPSELMSGLRGLEKDVKRELAAAGLEITNGEDQRPTRPDTEPETDEAEAEWDRYGAGRDEHEELQAPTRGACEGPARGACEGPTRGACEGPAGDDGEAGDPVLGVEEGPGPNEEFGQADFDEVVAVLRRKYLTLASTLEKAVAWDYDGKTLRIVCPSRFHAENARKEIAVLSTTVRERVGRQIAVEVGTETSEAEKKSPEHNNEAERRVEMIKRVFRGEVIDG